MSLRKYPPVGIMFALEKELRRYLDRLTHHAVHNAAGLEIFEAEFADHRVLLTNGGLGKVNASIAATLLCDRFECGMIAFPGLAWIPTESESPDGRIRQGIHSTQQFDRNCQIE
jgi:hypothetical protein